MVLYVYDGHWPRNATRVGKHVTRFSGPVTGTDRLSQPAGTAPAGAGWQPVGGPHAVSFVPDVQPPRQLSALPESGLALAYLEARARGEA